MATSESEWWRKVSCHFTWDLETTNVDHKSLKTNVESKLFDWADDFSSPPCQPLLLLGFLNVSKFKESPKQNPREAIKLFKNVEKEADKMEIEEEKRAFLIVALANQMWSKEIVSQSQQAIEEDGTHSDETSGEEDKDLDRLKEHWNTKDEKTEAYIEGIASFVLARLGPKKYKEGEERIRKALSVVPDNPLWHHRLGCFIGRMIRYNLVSSKEEYNHIEDEINCYGRALELNPEFDLARCDMAQALVKVPNRKEEAFDHIGRVKGISCSTAIKKGRFYRSQQEYGKALEIFKKAESDFDRPRGELFFQMSLIYSALAYRAGFDKNWTEKNENLELQIKYSDKCLSIEPRHHLAMIRRAQALGYMRRNDQAEAGFKEAIKEFKDVPNNFVEIQFAYAEFLTSINRRRVTPYAAKLYKGAMSTASAILQDSGDDTIEDVKTGMKKFVTKSKEKLQEFYKDNTRKMAEVEEMFAKFHF